jgi:hypothetical protein
VAATSCRRIGPTPSRSPPRTPRTAGPLPRRRPRLGQQPAGRSGGERGRHALAATVGRTAGRQPPPPASGPHDQGDAFLGHFIDQQHGLRQQQLDLIRARPWRGVPYHDRPLRTDLTTFSMPESFGDGREPTIMRPHVPAVVRVDSAPYFAGKRANAPTSARAMRCRGRASPNPTATNSAFSPRADAEPCRPSWTPTTATGQASTTPSPWPLGVPGSTGEVSAGKALEPSFRVPVGCRRPIAVRTEDKIA